MSLKVFEANVISDIEDMLSILNRNRMLDVGADRFKWLYLDNPYGVAKVWIVSDEEKGINVAFTSVLPRAVYVNGVREIVWNCSDFSVDKRYRTLGVALKLRRKAKDCIDKGIVKALYAHPNDRMQVIHDRVGHYKIGEMQRYVFLLKVNDILCKKIGILVIANFLSFFVNLFLFTFGAFRRCSDNFQFTMLKGTRFDEKFDLLFGKVVSNCCVIGERSSRYLNWRYYENPLQEHDRVELFCKGEFVGYTIYYIKGNVAVVKDIICLEEKHGLALLKGLTDHLRTLDVNSISFIVLNSCFVQELLVKFGFKARPEKSSVYGYVNKGTDLLDKWIDGSRWYMTVGDRDV